MRCRGYGRIGIEGLWMGYVCVGVSVNTDTNINIHIYILMHVHNN